MVTKTKEEHLGVRLVLTSVSAVVAESATFPIDITKTRLQLQGEKGPLIASTKGAVKTAIALVREEGYQGLYKGLSPGLLRHVFYTSTRILTYEQLRSATNMRVGTNHKLSVLQQALLGGISGVIGQVLASPADLIKVRIQSDGRLVKLGLKPRYTGMFDAFSKIVRQDGFLGLWRGVGPNAQRAFLVNMGELSCYDQSKQFLVRSIFKNDNIYAHTLASMMSGLCATTLSCPADVIKTRIMNQASCRNDGKPAVYKNSFDCLTKTVRAEGIMALWKGFFPTWARLGPWQLIFWVSYERLRQMAGILPF
ncbi:hypothetical protein L7F22_028092 [Adiantum nelumboides]|nr:hypothetical protein [Adiantum nelumboides]